MATAPKPRKAEAPRGRSATQGTLGRMVTAATPVKPKLHVSPQRTLVGKPGRINLKAVAEVLAERGLDPTAEIIKILAPVDDATGERTTSQLDPDVQARTWNELLQYTQPKLKSVEIKAKVAATAFDVSNDQARAIAEEFLRSGAGAAAMGDTALESDE